MCILRCITIQSVRMKPVCLGHTKARKKCKNQKILVLSNYVTVFERCTYVHSRQIEPAMFNSRKICINLQTVKPIIQIFHLFLKQQYASYTLQIYLQKVIIFHS